MSEERTASDVLVERLIEWGADTIFGLPGDGINGFMEALRKHPDKMRYIHVRHEEVAAMAAVGYAKFTGKLGVCFSTAAPGAVHMINGLLDAKVEQAPVLAITGMTYHDLIGTSYLQDVNTDYLLNDVALYNQRIMGPQHVINVVDYAVRTSLTHRGPSHLAFPIDYQAMPAEGRLPVPAQRARPHLGQLPAAGPGTHPPGPGRRRGRPAGQDQGRHPGRGGRPRRRRGTGGGSRQARRPGDQGPARQGLHPRRLAVHHRRHRPGRHAPLRRGPRAVRRAAHRRLDHAVHRVLPGPGQAVCVQIDDKPERIGLRYPVDIGLTGDARATLAELLPLLPRNENRDFLSQAQEGMKEWWALMEERGTSPDTPMKPQVPAWALNEMLADDAIICGDSGTVTTWAARQIKVRRGQQFSFSGTNCSMAAGLPYAIGAAAAYPGRQVVVFTGDGSLTMQLGDFLTAVQHDLSVKIVVIKNNTLGLIKWEQMVFLGNPEYGVNMAPLDFVKFAEAAGARGMHIEDPRTCAAADARGVLLGRPGDHRVPGRPARAADAGQGQEEPGHDDGPGAAAGDAESQPDRLADGQGPARRVQLRRQPRPRHPGQAGRGRIRDRR